MSGIIGHRGLLSAVAAANFREAMLASNPLAYYPMDETSLTGGAVMHALAGANSIYLGSPAVGNPAILPNDPGRSMGTAVQANRGRVTRMLTGSGDFTFCMAVRTSKVDGQMIVFDQDQSSGVTNRHFLAFNRSDNTNNVGTPGSICFFGHNAASQPNRSAYALGADVCDGQPHLVMWGRNFGAIFIDVDGVAQTITGSSMSNTIMGGTYWGIGQTPLSGASAFTFVGDVAHFAVWDRPLPLTERTDLAAAAGFSP